MKTTQGMKISERGQALVLFTAAIIGLIALTGLAVDGGNAFADRRSAQNAADTAALASSLAKIRNNSDWKIVGKNRAADNGYDNNGTSNSVEIHACNEAAATCSSPYNGANANEYIQVIIVSQVDTYLSQVVGIFQLTNRVQAIAHAKPPETKSLYDGNAMVGLAPHDCSTVVYQGNANATLTGGGIFVNSDCATSAFFNHSGSAYLTSPWLSSVGGIQYVVGALNIPSEKIQNGFQPYPYPPEYLAPTYTCDHTWYGTFPPHGVTHVSPGVHCLNGNFVIQANDVLTGTGVTFVVQSGYVKWNGGDLLQLSAPTSGSTKGLLVYLPITNTSSVIFNGNANWNISGTILAPGSDITVNGTQDGTAMNSQLIGYTVKLSGNGNTSINYNAADNWQGTFPPMLEMIK